MNISNQINQAGNLNPAPKINSIRIMRVKNGFVISLGDNFGNYSNYDKVAETFEGMCAILKEEFGLEEPGSYLGQRS